MFQIAIILFIIASFVKILQIRISMTIFLYLLSIGVDGLKPNPEHGYRETKFSHFVVRYYKDNPDDTNRLILLLKLIALWIIPIALFYFLISLETLEYSILFASILICLIYTISNLRSSDIHERARRSLLATQDDEFEDSSKYSM